jgi:hypothetical protein
MIIEGNLHSCVYSIEFTQLGWEIISATMKKRVLSQISQQC